MKKILLSLACSFSVLAALAQDIKPIAYSEVVTVEGASKDELYDRAKNWVVKTYNNPQKVIQLDDREKGQLSIKGLFDYGFRGCTNKVTYMMSIYVKDGRYKYEMNDMVFTAYGSARNQIDFGTLTNSPEAPQMRGYIRSTMQKLWTEAQLQSDAYSKSTFGSLKAAMTTATESQSDNW